MKRTETVTFTNMCMIYDENRNVVVQQRVKNWPGVAFPGGHVEAGEAFTDAVIREVREETGLHISNLQLCGIKDWIEEDGARYMVLLYKTGQFEGELTSSEEGEVWWMPLEQLRAGAGITLAEDMQTMLQLFCGDCTEQFFYLEHGSWVEALK